VIGDIWALPSAQVNTSEGLKQVKMAGWQINDTDWYLLLAAETIGQFHILKTEDHEWYLTNNVVRMTPPGPVLDSTPVEAVQSWLWSKEGIGAVLESIASQTNNSIQTVIIAYNQWIKNGN
jgi:hypothetical protein